MSSSHPLQDQSQRLPRRTLFVTLGCLTASLFVSFFDQTAVTTAIPSIAKDLSDSSTISSWVGTSYLIANTNFQLLYGRLSDIFGRKQVFLFSLLCLLVGNLVSGFSNNPIMLFVFRGISGLGGGGINCLVMITFSDLLTTRERGKYFGFVALSTTLGNGIGPLIGGVLSEKASWRWTFWISCPISVVCGLLVICFVPLKPVTGSFKEKLKQLDYLGFFLSLVGTIFVLVAISGGGDNWPWKGAIFITLIVIGSLACIGFLLSEHYLAKIPIIPLHLFNHFQRSYLFLMCFLMGWAYFVDIYYYPLYLQNVRGWSPIMSGVLQLPSTSSSSVFGIIAGFINSKTGHYVRCLYFGGAMWCLGTGLKILFGLHTSPGLLVGANLIQGLGIGFTFQPTLLALLSHSNNHDRAIVTGLRNFFRCFGGSVGLIISGIVFNTIFKSRLRHLNLSDTEIEHIISNPDFSSISNKILSHEVKKAYLHCFKTIMIILTAMSAAMLVLSLMTKDGKEPETEKEAVIESSSDDKTNTSK
ncbi:hypothetical protein CANTEDRAFT_109342 [Yamadazyma tenuis ATCC 10573]|uniref:Major facilitator superfamily (MFS) profile domain-containing protein n=1 Tax=Candida tenuis (strain ATCC 10573 / BCRC 21748 / CBS 615 / JCM 9827 / NBRC 10315 / NRRL Y-1498 / VKM Y-70) TaxID=590646 RepID=G3B883_CANTC|nr:uncharacterized protein CANTEDRAFT_109342 [Yamadazyma tenuis ATCC 10573]EGV61709.1 hypothetical protein CANTEDRAFT_109342 [Yamadazyma tenuis ATCC 10573]